jgi:hypothetical protein
MTDTVELTVNDFVTALTVRDPADVEDVLRDMFSVATSARAVGGDVTGAISALIRLPGHQVQVLKVLNSWLPHNNYGARSGVALETLQTSAREYRATLPDDPEHRELRSQLDRLIEFRPPQ